MVRARALVIVDGLFGFGEQWKQEQGDEEAAHTSGVSSSPNTLRAPSSPPPALTCAMAKKSEVT
jgi:hypothetical protein